MSVKPGRRRGPRAGAKTAAALAAAVAADPSPGRRRHGITAATLTGHGATPDRVRSQITVTALRPAGGQHPPPVTDKAHVLINEASTSALRDENRDQGEFENRR